MAKLVAKFWVDRSGATAIEYGLIGAFIFLAIISSVTAVGTQVGVVFTKVKGNL